MFLGHTTSADLLKGISDGLTGLDLSKQIQLLTDGPSINWKVLSEIIKQKRESWLINIGSCSLHVVHGAIQSATEPMSWNLSPACCEDYISITESTVFPLQFFPIEWVNFSDSRGIDQLALDSIMVVFPLSTFSVPTGHFPYFHVFFLHDPLKLIQSLWTIIFKHLWQYS